MPQPDTDRQPSRIWQAVLGQVELQVSRPVFETWLAGTRATSLEGNVLSVEAPNPFAVESIEKRMYQTLLKSLRRVAGDTLDLRFHVPEADSTKVAALDAPRAAASPPPSLNQHYTFANFAVGPSNELTTSAAEAVARAPGSSYNPLFVHAPPGLGKTHLLHAIAHTAYSLGADVCYVTSEHFTNDFVQGIRTRTSNEVRDRYRSVDLLLVDDIQFLAGKQQTLEGFFHTFGDLHTSGKQLVITSNQPPSKLDFLDDKLRSRFQSGLTTDLQPPGPDTRLAILRAKAYAMGVGFEEAALAQLAAPEVENVREMEGVFTKAVALATLHNTDITIDIAAEAIKSIGTSNSPREAAHFSQERLLSTVMDYFGVTHAELTGRRRSQTLLAARKVAIHIMSSTLRLGVTEIAKALGRDHSTISLTIKRLQQTLPSDATLQADINAINQILQQ